jgi:hypothetical protein
MTQAEALAWLQDQSGAGSRERREDADAPLNIGRA